MCWNEKGDHIFSRIVAHRKCEGNIGKAVEQEETLCDKMETVRDFTYLYDKVSAGGACEAAVTATQKYFGSYVWGM